MDIVEKITQMMIRCGLATGHGDAIDDLLFELEKQIKNTSNAFSDARKEIERLREALKLERQLKDYALRAFNEARSALQQKESE